MDPFLLIKKKLLMKIILILLIVFSYEAYGSNNPKESFEKATKRILHKKKDKIIKNLSLKIGMPEDIIKKFLTISETKNQITVNGHSYGTLGVCEIFANLKLKTSQSIATCISDNDKVTIIFP